MRKALAALLVVCLLGGCEGFITSVEPLLVSREASLPLPDGAEVMGQSLGDNLVWEKEKRTTCILLANGSYWITASDQATPAPDSFLFKQIGSGQYVVQASNGSEWVYALILLGGEPARPDQFAEISASKVPLSDFRVYGAGYSTLDVPQPDERRVPQRPGCGG